MKNKMLNKVCSFALALFMAMTILPTTAFAGSEDDDNSEEKMVFDIRLPETLTTTADPEDGTASGATYQEVTSTSKFQTIFIKPVTGKAFTNRKGDIAFANLITAAGDSGLSIDYKHSTSGYDGILEIYVSSLGPGLKHGVTIYEAAFDTKDSYVMYGGNSFVGEPEDSDRNKMNAQFDSSTGKLTFKGYPYSNDVNALEYHPVDGDGVIYRGISYNYSVTGFICDVYKGTASEATTDASILNFKIANDTTTDYAANSVTNPSVNLRKIIEDNSTSFEDSDYLWIKVSTVNGEKTEPADTDRSFYINAGKVSDIKGDSSTERTVEITLCDNVVKAANSGDLTQTLKNSMASFTNILLETKPGYAFSDDTVTNLNAVLNDNGLTAEKTSYYQLTIKPTTSSAAIQSVEATVDADTLTTKYVIYNGTSTVGKTGDANKMNAQYDLTSGKLTFNCDQTDALERVTEDGSREEYVNAEIREKFRRFTSTVKATHADGTSDNIMDIDIGGGEAYKHDYSSEETVNPYIYLKKLVTDSKLTDTDTITINVTACSSAGRIENYNFTINAGTVAEILGKKVDPTPTPTPTASSSTKKNSGGWDDGSPFTTDTCGNVFDRWGNKIYEAKGCNVGGYNLVRTSVED